MKAMYHADYLDLVNEENSLERFDDVITHANDIGEGQERGDGVERELA